MLISHLILAICWILYCLLHSVLANEKVKVLLIRITGFRMNHYRIAYNVFAFVTLAAILLYHTAITSFYVLQENEITLGIALLSGIPGLLIMFMCIRKYFMQMSGLKSGHDIITPVLETKGIHRYVRHPLYLGTFLFLGGLFFIFPLFSNLLAVVIIITYTLLAIPLEEKKLVSEFGDAYKMYQKEVGMIIPFLK